MHAFTLDIPTTCATAAMPVAGQWEAYVLVRRCAR